MRYFPLTREFNVELISEITIATSKAAKKPETVIPDISRAKRRIIIPLITKEKSPKVKKVIGNDKM